MAEGYNERIILKNEEAISDGHRVLIDLVVDNLAAKEAYDLKQDYITRCEVLTTSWKFRMIFQPAAPNGIVNIPVSLKRFDSMGHQVNASVSVSLSDCRNQLFFGGPRNFIKPRMGSGGELLAYVNGTLHFPQHIALFNEMLIVHVVIEIRYCHSGFSQ